MNDKDRYGWFQFLKKKNGKKYYILLFFFVFYLKVTRQTGLVVFVHNGNKIVYNNKTGLLLTLHLN